MAEKTEKCPYGCHEFSDEDSRCDSCNEAAKAAVVREVVVTRGKVYPTPGRNYRVAWKWVYTVCIPGEPYTFSGDTLSWVKWLCKDKAPTLPVRYAWKKEGK